MIRKTLKELCCLPGVSGYEDCVGKYMFQWFRKYTSRVTSDTAGNLIAEFKSRNADAKRVMVFAHMDQLGFVVKRIDDAGFLRIERLGGIPEKILPGLEVMVRNRKGEWISGVIGNKSHHVTDASEKYRVIPISELYVDMGFSSTREAKESGILTGCPVVYKPRFESLHNEKC